MNRSLQYLNLVGVVALTVLCGLQWRANRQANLEISRLEKVRLEQKTALEEQEKKSKGAETDLEGFRQQLERLAEVSRGAEKKLADTELKLRLLTDEREVFQKREGDWQAAVAARDEQVQKANTELTKLATERNDAVKRYNELVEKYNAAAKEIGELRAKNSSSQ